MFVLVFLCQRSLLGKPLDDVPDPPALLLAGLIGVIEAVIGAVCEAN
jgi:hypothetical protein